MTFSSSSSSSSSFPRPRPSFSDSRHGGNQSRDEHRINHRIRVPEVLLIDETGHQVGVVRTEEALRMARDRGLDLMEVAPNARPPVCKIIDYGKFKYEKKKKDHEAKRKQAQVKTKEIQVRPNTDDHDLDFKMRNARTFLESGDKTKITMLFRGRQMAHTDLGFKMMEGILEKMKDVCTVEAPPKMDGKKLIMVLAPVVKKVAPAAKKQEQSSAD